MTIQKQSVLFGYTHKMVKSDSPIFNDKVGKKNMFTAIAEFFCPFYQKSYFATNPLTKPYGKTIFQKANKTQEQGSRYQAKIIPWNSADAKKKKKKKKRIGKQISIAH